MAGNGNEKVTTSVYFSSYSDSFRPNTDKEKSVECGGSETVRIGFTYA